MVEDSSILSVGRGIKIKESRRSSGLFGGELKFLYTPSLKFTINKCFCNIFENDYWQVI